MLSDGVATVGQSLGRGFECNRLFSTVMFEGAKDGAYTALVRLHLKVASR